MVRMDDLEDSGLEVPSLLLTLELARSLTSGSTHRSESLDLACHNPWVRKDSERQLLKARAETAKPKDSEGRVGLKPGSALPEILVSSTTAGNRFYQWSLLIEFISSSQWVIYIPMYPSQEP